jgi:hypothetical protein
MLKNIFIHYSRFDSLPYLERLSEQPVACAVKIMLGHEIQRFPGFLKTVVERLEYIGQILGRLVLSSQLIKYPSLFFVFPRADSRLTCNRWPELS